MTNHSAKNTDRSPQPQEERVPEPGAELIVGAVEGFKVEFVIGQHGFLVQAENQLLHLPDFSDVDYIGAEKGALFLARKKITAAACPSGTSPTGDSLK